MSNPTVLLQEQIQEADALMQLPIYSPKYKIWCDTTTKIIRENFTDTYADMFNKIWSKRPRYASEAEERRAFIKMLVEKVQLLQAIIDEYNRFHNDPAVDISRSLPLQAYDFHQEIKAVALRLYEDKHYPQAVEEMPSRFVCNDKQLKKAS